MANEQFRMAPGGEKMIRKEMFTKVVPFMALSMLGTFFIFFYHTTILEDIWQYGVFLFLVVALSAFSLYRVIKQYEQIYSTYILTFTGESIKREQYNTPDVSIPYTQVTQIVQNVNGSFTIKGAFPSETIAVPKQIENYERVESLLAGIKPFTDTALNKFLQRFWMLGGIITLGLMAIIYRSGNTILTTTAGIILIAILIASVIIIRRNKSIDNNTRRKILWTIPVIIGLTGYVILKFISPEKLVMNMLSADIKGNMYLLKGQAMYDSSDFNGAIINFNKAIEANPRSAKAYYHLGLCYYMLDSYDSSINYFSKAIDRDSNYMEAYAERAYLLSDAGDTLAALHDYTKLVELDPENAGHYVDRGYIYNSLRYYDEAIADYTTAVRIDSEYSEAYYNRGMIYFNLNKSTAACEDWNRVLELGDSSVIEDLEQNCRAKMKKGK